MKNALVKVNGNAVTTTSLNIAENFGKRHKTILRKIQTLDCTRDFTGRNFVPSEYKDSTGRRLTCYEITRDGFTYLAMGFTGKKAAMFKEKYIEAFNAMEKELQKRSVPDAIDSTMLKQIAINMERLEIERDDAIATKHEISNKKTASAMGKAGVLAKRNKKLTVENTINEAIRDMRNSRTSFYSRVQGTRCSYCNGIIKKGGIAVAKKDSWVGIVHHHCNNAYVENFVRNQHGSPRSL